MEGVVKALFDIRFEKYITPSIAGIIMYVSYVVVAVMWALMAIQGGFYGFFMAVIGLPLTIVFLRIWFEGLVALVKTAEASSKIARLMEEKNSNSQS